MKKVKRRTKYKWNKKLYKHGHTTKYWEEKELDQWDKDQAALSYRRERKRLEAGGASLLSPKRSVRDKRWSELGYTLTVWNASQQKIKSWKDAERLLDLDHLKDLNGKVQYWGALPASLRPKPKLLANGDRSPEDLLFNPKNPKGVLSQRYGEDRHTLKKLILSIGFPLDQHHIRVDEPGKIDAFIQNTGIRLSVKADPEEETRPKGWMRTSVNGSERYFTKAGALKHCEDKDLLTYDGSSDEYYIKRYRVKVKNGVKKLIVLEKIKL